MLKICFFQSNIFIIISNKVKYLKFLQAFDLVKLYFAKPLKPFESLKHFKPSNSLHFLSLKAEVIGF